MRKKSIMNFFHYLVKYMLIALPIILMLIAEIYKPNFETKVEKVYATNEVESVNDLFVNHMYHFENAITFDTHLEEVPIIIYNVNVASASQYDRNYAYSYMEGYRATSTSDSGKFTINITYYNGIETTAPRSRELRNFVGNFDFVLLSVDDPYLSEIVPYLSASDFSVVEGVSYGLDDQIYNWFDSFANLPINNFYNQFGAVFGLDNIDTHTPLGVMYYMPLWILYIYIFDLMLDTIVFIPKLAHKWMEKLGGYDD